MDGRCVRGSGSLPAHLTQPSLDPSRQRLVPEPFHGDQILLRHLPHLAPRPPLRGYYASLLLGGRWAAGATVRGKCHNRPMRFFNTEGPVRPDDHYAIRPLDRVNIDEFLA